MRHPGSVKGVSVLDAMTGAARMLRYRLCCAGEVAGGVAGATMLKALLHVELDSLPHCCGAVCEGLARAAEHAQLMVRGGVRGLRRRLQQVLANGGARCWC